MATSARCPSPRPSRPSPVRMLVAVVIGGVSVVLLLAGVNGSAEPLFGSVFGSGPKKKTTPPAAGPKIAPPTTRKPVVAV